MANELAKTAIAGHQLPDFLKGKTAQHRMGNLDNSDLIIPRVKILQAIDPLVTEFDNAKAGNFWHTLRQENLGPSILGIPITTRKSFLLWAPRGDERGILARSMDGIHWDPPNAEFTVKPKDSPHPITWRTAPTVAESGLAEFGSSIPGDPGSKPAAALNYETLWHLPEHDTNVLIINTRSAVSVYKHLYSAIFDRKLDSFYQVFTITTSLEKSANGPYFNYKYLSAGFVQDPVLGKNMEDLHAQMKEAKFRADDEEADTPAASGAPERRRETAADKKSKY